MSLKYLQKITSAWTRKKQAKISLTRACFRQHAAGSTLMRNNEQAIARKGPGVRAWYTASVTHQLWLDVKKSDTVFSWLRASNLIPATPGLFSQEATWGLVLSPTPVRSTVKDNEP